VLGHVARTSDLRRELRQDLLIAGLRVARIDHVAEQGQLDLAAHLLPQVEIGMHVQDRRSERDHPPRLEAAQALRREDELAATLERVHGSGDPCHGGESSRRAPRSPAPGCVGTTMAAHARAPRHSFLP
jgi:hypothetical protein